MSESVCLDNLVEILLLMDVNIPRFLLYVHAQIPGAFSLVGNRVLFCELNFEIKDCLNISAHNIDIVHIDVKYKSDFVVDKNTWIVS